MKRLLLPVIAILFNFISEAQDTTIVQTFTLDSDFREGVFTFPDDPGATYEKIIMQYRMRCFDAQVGNGNIGCHEWDYHCNTVVTDSSMTDSLWSTHPDHVITGTSANPYYYSVDPTFTYYRFVQKQVEYTAVIAEDSAVIGNGVLNLDFPFSTDHSQGKTQLLWTADELTAAGLVAGEITGLRFTVDNSGDEIHFLKIKLKQTEKTELEPNDPDTEGFTEVYFLNTSFPGSGKYSFNFYNNFTWDGTSNLLAEFSFTGADAGVSNPVKGYNTALQTAISTNEQDGYLKINYGDYIVVPSAAFASVDSAITVSFWQYGDPDINPYDSYLFEGGDANNNRVINCHLPWSNSRVYWDAGNSGTSSYDRIDKEAQLSDYAGKWNHWALTKNVATGEMKIYLNGILWHSGTDKFLSMEGITSFAIASPKTYQGRYGGFLNEFRVWNTDLDENTIKDWMYKDITPDHPAYSHLLFYYKFDEDNGNTVTDYSPNGFDGSISGQPLWVSLSGQQLYRNFTGYTQRPNVEIVQGNYLTSITDLIFYDSLQNGYNTVYGYYEQNNNLYPEDTNHYWEAGYMDVIDESGEIVDSVYIAPDDSISIETLEYYQRWPARFELLSFITPYGNGLDLGIEGKMWEFDVTDFAPILRGDKFLSIEGVGKWSEEYDIRFLFIHGTPPRDVLSVQSIWPIASPGQIWYSFSPNDIWNDIRFEPREILMNPDASMYKVRSAITGHGQNGEFSPKWHYINIDGGDNEFEYQVWKECSTIPVYPQGGTWIFDRAGWCPGDPTTLFEFNITPYVNPGEVHTLDYGLVNITGLNQADYRISNQLVSYGEPNFNLDASIQGIIRPNKEVAANDRFNPVCMNPEIIIQNTGSTELNSLDIEYQVEGGDLYNFTWNGNLDFLDTAKVVLPVSDLSFWEGTANVFHVSISNPNGGIDEYPNNNVYQSAFESSDVYDISEELELHCLTNNHAYQTSYYLEDADGNILLERGNLENNTLYTDQLNLAPGCYKIRIDDSNDNGLYFWYNTGQGSGYLRLKNSSGFILENFEPEFGRFAIYEFSVADLTGVNENAETSIFSIYPNPASDEVTLKMTGYENRETTIQLIDITGKVMMEETLEPDQYVAEKMLDVSRLNSGIYVLRVNSAGKTSHHKIIVR